MILDKVERNIYDGTQTIYRFHNGYGASIVNHKYSFGLELAVLKYSSQNTNTLDFDVCYDTNITNDVIKNMTISQMQRILIDIENL